MTALAALAWTPGFADAQAGASEASAATGEAASITGVVWSEEAGLRTPLPHALVEVSTSRGPAAVLADARGRYVIRDVASGPRRLRASHPGFASVELEVAVPSGGTLRVDVSLEPRPLEIPGLRVRAPVDIPIPEVEARDAPDPGARAVLGLRSLEATPGLVETGVAGGPAGRAPGDPPADPRDVLVVRGSTEQSRLVLLDGAPIVTPFHTGGLLPSFEIDALASAVHHVGGAPARYDGGVSYILDLQTRAGREGGIRGWGSADLLGLRGGVEAGGGRISGLVVGRALHDLGGALAGGSASPYGYGDLLVRGDVRTGAEHRVAVTGFLNRESVHLGVEPTPTFPGIDRAHWGNRALSTRFIRTGDDWGLELGAAGSSYEASLPFRSLQSAVAPEEEALRIASGTTRRLRLTADVRLPSALGGLRVGGSWDRTTVEYGSRTAGDASLQSRGQGSVAGLYLDGIRPLGPELALRFGGRVDHFEPGGVAPALRLALAWTLRPDVVLTLAGGRYHQLVRDARSDVAVTEGDPLDLGVDLPGPGTRDDGLPLLAVAGADHLTLSLDQILEPSIRIRLAGFVKRFHPLGTTPATTSSGVDLQVQRRGERLTAWLGYSLAWSWETRTESGDEAAFSGRHLLSAGVEGRLVGPLGVDLRLSLSDGLPVTAVPLATSNGATGENESPVTPGGPDGPVTLGSPQAPADGFLRLDAEVFADWAPTVGDRQLRLRPYVRLLNALDRRDALFWYFEPWRDDGFRPLAELSVIPVAGVEWRF